MTVLRIPANRHRHLPQLGALDTLHRGVKAVAVAVQDGSVQAYFLLCRFLQGEERSVKKMLTFVKVRNTQQDCDAAAG